MTTREPYLVRGYEPWLLHHGDHAREVERYLIFAPSDLSFTMAGQALLPAYRWGYAESSRESRGSEGYSMNFLKRPAALKWLAPLLFLFLTVDVSAAIQQSSADSPLEVVISHPSSPMDAESGVIVITLTNHSDSPILTPIQRTPISRPHKRQQMGAVLEVKDAAGKQARFIGSFIDFVKDADPSTMYVRIEPGQTISGEVDLSLDYDLKAGGAYRVSYEQAYGGVELLKAEIVAKNSVKSNALDIWVNTSLIGVKSLSLITPQDNGERECTTSEKSQLVAAKMTASGWLWNAALYGETELWDYVMDTSSGEITYNSKLKPDDKYTIWMGVPLNDLQPVTESYGRDLMSDPEVWNHVDFLPLHLAYANSKRMDKVSFKCGCPSGDAPTKAAEAHTSNPYEVVVCDIYFNLADSNKAVTLIHEVSHFSDADAPMTQDYANGSAPARDLARTNHAQAVLNADSFAYWVEAVNQP